jgi:hypothetical protein
MDDLTEKLIERGNQRIHIIRRTDGSYTFKHQRKIHGEWGGLGPLCGFFDSAKTAEAEARARVWWLREPL